MSSVFLLLAKVVDDLLWRRHLLPTHQADELVVHQVRMLAHDVLLSGLTVSESVHLVLFLAAKTTNPLLPAPHWLCALKLQLVFVEARIG